MCYASYADAVADCKACALQLKLMTSWAVVCDVYFLEPQTKHKDESSQQFAERVQKLIANRAKLHIAPWDGYLKYYNLGDKVWLHHLCIMLVGNYTIPLKFQVLSL